MNRDDIIRLAREAGWWQPLGLPSDWEEGDYVVSPEQMLRFATLVAAAEREECAKVCERLPAQQDRDVRDECAAFIRARGNP